MKNGKVTFADFRKFMEFLGLWEEYKKEAKKGNATLKEVSRGISIYYVYKYIDWANSSKGFDFWSAVDNFWCEYIKFKETEEQK